MPFAKYVTKLDVDIEEAYSSFEDDRLCYLNEGDKEAFIYEGGVATTLSKIEAFAQLCYITTEAGFDIAGQGVKRLRLGRYLDSIDAWMKAFDPRMKYSPNVEAVFCAARETSLLDAEPGKCYAGNGNVEILRSFNNFLTLIRNKLKSKEFKSKIQQINRKLRENYLSSRMKIDSIFDSFSRVVVIRMDFSFIERFEIRQVKIMFAKFLNNRRSNSIFEDEVGYIWCLEYGEKKGYHYHCFFFFNGAKVHKDAYRGELIGAYWKRITDDAGTFYNCNRKKSNYRYLAIGKVENFDSKMRENLSMALLYFFKREQLLSIRFDQSVIRTFGMGFKKKILSGRGRPRKFCNYLG